MNAFSVPPNYVASLQENLTDDVLRSPNADPQAGRLVSHENTTVVDERMDLSSVLGCVVADHTGAERDRRKCSLRQWTGPRCEPDCVPKPWPYRELGQLE